MGVKSTKKEEKIFNSSSYIVGIGASAGGLEAINEFFENMPDNTGFSYVIVQHISPDHKSLMAELLSKHTTMAAIEAEDGMLVKPNCIYVIPSKKFMTIKGGKLHLQEKEKSKLPNNAIDVFFESLAVENKEYAVGIILSGTGTDGSKGVSAIKKNGGTVIVQDPVSAAFDGMPNSAIATNTVDMITVPELMAEQLVELLNDSPQVKQLNVQNERMEFILRDILVKVRNATALDFSYYKRPTLFRRLSKRMSELGINNIMDYQNYLDQHIEEIHVISKEFLINVSSFFRDKEAFNTVRTVVIPAIMKDKKHDDTVKAWSVACSTGEEAYSMAILFKEYQEKHKLHDLTVKIFATDIDKDALETASRGVYTRSATGDVPAEYLAKYFLPEGNAYRIHPDIRRMVVFSYHDILKDPPYSRMDVVSCRNMLIYIHPHQQKDILKKLQFSLNLEGYLFLGSSENVGIMKGNVVEIDKKWKIYQCVAKTQLHDHDAMFSLFDKKSHLPAAPSVKVKNALQHIPEIFSEAILEENRFAGIFINLDFEVKQAIGNYKNFLDFPEAGFNFNLLKLVKPDLSMALSIAIRKAIKDNIKTVAKNIKIKENGKERNISITVKPHLKQQEYIQPFLFIVLSENEIIEAKQAYVISPDNLQAEEQIAALERELSDTRSNLQALIEEVETSNEELQSSNEEMISTNEELQSTNEELQSLNEELHTVSAEHQQKIKELTELNDDLNNYFRNSDTGQILVDRKLIIRKFTPAITRMINIIDSDINRSIADITTKIKNRDLVDDIKTVIRTGESVEKEISLSDRGSFLMRITPFTRQDGSIDGVVVNFVDVSEIKKLNSIVEAIFNSSSSAIDAKRVVRDNKKEIIDFEFIAANLELQKVMNGDGKTIIGKRASEVSLDMEPKHFDRLKEVFETGTPAKYDYFDAKNKKWYEIRIVKIIDGLVTTATDITDQKLAADQIAQSYAELKTTSNKLEFSNSQLERSNMDLMQFASVASHDLKEPLRKIETFGNILFSKVQDRFQDGELNYLEKIIKSSSRMQSLIEDVLTLSKLSNQKVPSLEVNLTKILNGIKDDLEITIKEKKAVITLGELPVVDGVPGQLHQLFQNLVSNALKFNDSKKPTITIVEKKMPAQTATELKIKPDDYYYIEVKDNGIGFEQEFKEKIFGIFQRLHGSQYDGTGIGLAISRKIAENHNGFLLADSELGKGTRFYVILPKNVKA